MIFSTQSILSLFTATLMFSATVQPSYAAPEDHVVSPGEIERQIRGAAEQRSKDMADIERVLSYPAAVQELAKYNVNSEQVHQAVATLTDTELARLADRARASEADVQGGLIVGLLALIGLIVVIIVVVSLVAEARSPDSEASARHGGVEHAAAVAQIASVYGC